MAATEGRIVQIMGKYHLAWDGEQVRPAFPGGRLALTSGGLKNRVAVGDRVVLRHEPDGSALIEEVLPRSNKLSRKMTFTGREHVVAANVDLLVVMLAPTPSINTALLDRYLVAARGQEIPVAAVVNKMDLMDEEDVAEVMAPYGALAVPTYRMSAKLKTGLGPFLEGIAGKWALLVGHSGVGKTTLVNDLDPEGAKAVGEVHEARGKGRHTTSTVVAHRLAAGTVLVDTAGIREFALWEVDWRGVEAGFPEVFHEAELCKFPDCRHRSEPGCAVRRAVDEERLDPDRYASYLTLVAEVERSGRE